MLVFNSLGLLGFLSSVGLVMLLGAVIGPMLNLPEGKSLVFVRTRNGIPDVRVCSDL